LAVADIAGQLNMTFPPPDQLFALFRRGIKDFILVPSFFEKKYKVIGFSFLPNFERFFDRT
jgi:hypothetical protein